MRTFFAQVETRYRAIKNCPFTPAHVVKVFGGYMCFESDNDYRVWFKKQKKNTVIYTLISLTPIMVDHFYILL